MRRLRRISTGTVLAVLVALIAGLAIGRLTAPDSQTDPAGPHSNANGVPVGYAQTPQGAIAAASNYQAFLDSPNSLDPRALDRGLRQITTPGSGQLISATEASYGQARQALQRAGGASQSGPLVDENKQLGYRLASYNAHQARVVLWELGMVGDGQTVAPTGSFGSFTVDLRWSGGDWRLADDNQADGPAPQIQQAPTPAPQFVVAAQSFRGFRNAP